MRFVGGELLVNRKFFDFFNDKANFRADICPGLHLIPKNIKL